MNIKTLCKYLGGSISYGLSTPTSDKDERYVFLHKDYSYIIGLDRYEHECHQNDTEDIFGYELRHFLNLLHQGNTSCIEILYNDVWLELSPEWKYIQNYKTNLVDSNKLFKCLMGYCFSEKKLVLGERTGVLGGKRREHLEKYGYSYKNLVQYLRLCLCGKVMFQTGTFPVNIRSYDPNDLLYSIKTKPELYTKDNAIKLMDEYQKMLTKSYDEIKYNYKYDIDIANKICYDLYVPVILANKNYNKKYVKEK